MKRLTLFCLAALALPATARAGGTDTGGTGITATVPEICNIDASAITVDADDGSAAGTVLEMCNSGRGFRVVASHRALAEGEDVRVFYADEATRLDPSGMSDVAHRSGPTFGHVPVSIESSGLVQDLAISLGLAVI